MRLGVEAALVGRRADPRRRRGRRRPRRALRARVRQRSRDRLPGLRRPPGQRLRRRRLPRRGRRGLPHGRRGAARDRRHRVPADAHHRARGAARRRARARCRSTATGPRILGVHLEGPFLAPSRLGTHPAASRRDPDRALLERLLAAGPVRLMTLAPELPGRGRADRRPPGARRLHLLRSHGRERARRRTPPSTAACIPSRTSSTRCARSTTATRASPALRSRATT